MSSSDAPAAEGYEPPSYSNCDGVSERCPVSATMYGDYFTLGATVLYSIIFGVFLITQMVLMWRCRAWSFGAWLGVGTAFEVIGYVARSMMTQDPWNFGTFIAQNFCLFLAPTLVAAAISVTFKHLVLWYGPEWSVIRPSLYPWIFVGSDFLSIIIQGAGGGVSSIASSGSGDDQTLFDVGSNLLLAGVSFQVVNMTFCGGLILIYMWRRHKALKNGQMRLGSSWAGAGAGGVGDATMAPGLKLSLQENGLEDARTRRNVKVFICSLAVSYIAIIIRCIYRIPEMSSGWGSNLMQTEPLFMVFDGAMMIISICLLTVFHPCFFFPFMSKKGKAAETVISAPEEHEMGSAQSFAPEKTGN